MYMYCCYIYAIENAGSLCKVYGDNLQKLIEVLSQRSLRGKSTSLSALCVCVCVCQEPESGLHIILYMYNPL